MYNFFQLLKEFSVLLVTLPGGTRSWSCWWRCIIQSMSESTNSLYFVQKNSNLVTLLNMYMSSASFALQFGDFCTTWSLSCKGPIELNWFVTSDRRVTPKTDKFVIVHWQRNYRMTFVKGWKIYDSSESTDVTKKPNLENNKRKPSGLVGLISDSWKNFRK